MVLNKSERLVSLEYINKNLRFPRTCSRSILYQDLYQYNNVLVLKFYTIEHRETF